MVQLQRYVGRNYDFYVFSNLVEEKIDVRWKFYFIKEWKLIIKNMKIMIFFDMLL